MNRMLGRTWAVPGLLVVCFTAGIVLSLFPAIPGFIGAALAAMPLATIAWRLWAQR